MRKTRVLPHLWTKEEIRAVIDLWDKKTKQEIAEELGVTVKQVGYIANEIRKVYPALQKKYERKVTRHLIEAVVGELGLK